MKGMNRVEQPQDELIPLSPEIGMSIRKRMDTIPIFRTLGFGDVCLGRGSFESIVSRKSEYDRIFECFHGGLLMTIADSAAVIAVLTVCGSES
jgi:acyl-coenzyme A thioesterase PaaI-like protein